MAIELHLCEGGDFQTTTDFLECGNCSAIIPNKTRADGVVTCATCGSEWEPDEVPDARVEEIVQAVVDAANLRDDVRALRDAAEDARKELEAQATQFGPHLDPENSLFRVLRKLESVLEATKEGE